MRNQHWFLTCQGDPSFLSPQVVSVRDARRRYREGDRDGAIRACGKALSYCEEGEDADDLGQQIQREIDWEERRRSAAEDAVVQRREETKRAALSTGKWGLILGITIGLLTIVVIGAMMFWNWATGTLFPWLLAPKLAPWLIGVWALAGLLAGAIGAMKKEGGFIPLTVAVLVMTVGGGAIVGFIANYFFSTGIEMTTLIGESVAAGLTVFVLLGVIVGGD